MQACARHKQSSVQGLANDAAQKTIYVDTIHLAFENEVVEDLKMVDNGSGEIVSYAALTRIQPHSAATQGSLEALMGGEEQQGIPDFFNDDVRSAVLNAATETNRRSERMGRYGTLPYHPQL
jgi:hypothetical protein